MRLFYNDKYDAMSHCQMGARKQIVRRNNIFIINGIIKEQRLQIYDYRQMFDGIDLKQALSDIYDYGLNDDNISLIYKANKEIRMAVNTPSGLSEKQVLVVFSPD